MSKPPLGFVPEPLVLPLSSVLPSRKTPEGLLASRKFKQITASIEAVGLIEPLSVGKPNREGQHILLDGHTRLVALKQLGFDKAPCLVATDDESYTYNNRINRLSSIQEHLMIRRAVERGVTPEKLAKALDVDISHIIKKLNLLEGIWAAAGFDDTLLRWKMKPEVVHGEKKDIQPRVQARGGQAGHRAWRGCGPGSQGPGRSRERAAQVGS